MPHTGKCFCGAVELEVAGEPAAMGYCHCNSCRSWSGGPVNAFSLWKPEAVTVTKGAEHIATYSKTPMSFRKFCSKCGGHLMADHPPTGGYPKLCHVIRADIGRLAQMRAGTVCRFAPIEVEAARQVLIAQKAAIARTGYYLLVAG